MKIAVVDDNKTDFELFLKLIEAYGKKHQRTIYTQGFSGGEELLSEFQKGKFAAIFLDIYMGGINGVETAKAIRQKDDEVRLFFTTTSAEHLADGFAVEATHYLIKPLTEEKIEEAMHRLRFFFTKEDSIIVFPMKRLKFSNFLRCHRYSAVNLEAVVRVEDDSFVMTDGKRIFMRREGRKELKEKYYHYFLDKVREECEW